MNTIPDDMMRTIYEADIKRRAWVAAHFTPAGVEFAREYGIYFLDNYVKKVRYMLEDLPAKYFDAITSVTAEGRGVTVRWQPTADDDPRFLTITVEPHGTLYVLAIIAKPGESLQAGPHGNSPVLGKYETYEMSRMILPVLDMVLA